MSYYDNSRYAITYYDYGLSLLNKNSSEFFMDGKLTLDANYTLEEITSKLIEERVNEKGEGLGYNYLGLPTQLVFWWEKGMDVPIDYTPTIYRAFIMRYFNRQINQQTIDMHKLKLQQFFWGHQQSLILKYKGYTQTKLESTTDKQDTADGGTTVTTLGRSANSTVPENKVDVDVDSTTLDYADDFTKSKQDVTTKNDGTNESVTTNLVDKDLTPLMNVAGELDSLFRAVEREQLFMLC